MSAMKKPTRTQLLIGAAAIATAAAMVAVRDEPVETSEPVRVASVGRDLPGTATTQDSADDLDLDALRRPAKHAIVPDLFAPEATASATPPPRTDGPVMDDAPAAHAAPPAPPAPTFTYLGRVVDGRGTAVFLALGDRSIAVEAGQDVDGSYRLEAIGPDSLTVLHRPSGRRQQLPIPPRG